MRNEILIIISAVFLILTACSSNDPVSSALNGTWDGKQMQSGDTLTVSVNLNENNGSITGGFDYTMSSSGSALFGTSGFLVQLSSSDGLTGAFSTNNVTLKFGDVSFTGVINNSSNKISGTATFFDTADSSLTMFQMDLLKK